MPPTDGSSARHNHYCAVRQNHRWKNAEFSDYLAGHGGGTGVDVGREIDGVSSAPASDSELPRMSFERSFANANMRVLPVQERSRGTVERILAAGIRLGKVGGVDGLNLQAVAVAAQVRLGAVYRYFSTPEDLVRTIVRMWIIERFDRDRRDLAGATFATRNDVVAHLVQNLQRAVGQLHDEPGVSGRMRQRLIQDYYEVPYAEIWALAGDVCDAMARSGIDTADPGSRVRLAAAWAAAAAYVKMTLMQAPRTCGSPAVQAALAGIFWSALGDGAGRPIA